MDQRDEGEIWSRKVAIPPVVDGRSIAVVSDELTPSKVDRRESVVLEAGPDVRGARGQESDIKGPKVFKRRTDEAEVEEADKRSVGEGTTVKRGDELTN